MPQCCLGLTHRIVDAQVAWLVGKDPQPSEAQHVKKLSSPCWLTTIWSPGGRWRLPAQDGEAAHASAFPVACTLGLNFFGRANAAKVGLAQRMDTGSVHLEPI